GGPGRDRVGWSGFDDHVALARCRRTANHHRRAALADHAADMWLRAVAQRARVEVNAGAPGGKARDPDCSAAGTVEGCAVAGGVGDGGSGLAHQLISTVAPLIVVGPLQLAFSLAEAWISMVGALRVMLCEASNVTEPPALFMVSVLTLSSITMPSWSISTR